MRSLVRKILGISAVVAVVGGLPGWASAASFTLDQWNIGLFETNGDSVTVTTTATTVNFHFNQGSGILATDFQDLYFASPAFDSVIAGFSTSDGGGTGAYKGEQNPGNASAFPGTFWGIRHNGSNPINDLDVTFTFSSIPAGLSAASFVAHVQFGSGCSGFVGSTNVPTTAADSGCFAVPEPSTFFLVASGLSLITLGAAARRKWLGTARRPMPIA